MDRLNEFVNKVSHDKYYRRFINAIKKVDDYYVVVTNFEYPIESNRHTYPPRSLTITLDLFLEDDKVYLSDCGTLLEVSSKNGTPSNEYIASLIMKYDFEFDDGALFLEVNEENFLRRITRYARFVHRYYLGAGLASRFTFKVDDEIKNNIRNFFFITNECFKYPIDVFDEYEETGELPYPELDNVEEGLEHVVNDAVSINIFITYRGVCKWYDLVATYKDGHKEKLNFNNMRKVANANDYEQNYFQVNILNVASIELTSHISYSFVVSDEEINATATYSQEKLEDDDKKAGIHILTPGIIKMGYYQEPGKPRAIEFTSEQAEIIKFDIEYSNLFFKPAPGVNYFNVKYGGTKRKLHVESPFFDTKVEEYYNGTFVMQEVRETYKYFSLKNVKYLDEKGNDVKDRLTRLNMMDIGFGSYPSKLVSFNMPDFDLHLVAEYQEDRENLCHATFDISALLDNKLVVDDDYLEAEVVEYEVYKFFGGSFMLLEDHKEFYFPKEAGLILRIALKKKIDNLYLEAICNDKTKKYIPNDFIEMKDSNNNPKYVYSFYNNFSVKGDTTFILKY